MTDRDAQGTTHDPDLSEGGTGTPISGSPEGTGQRDPAMGSQDEDQQSGRGDGDEHSRLSGSNPEAPGYGSPTEGEGV